MVILLQFCYYCVLQFLVNMIRFATNQPKVMARLCYDS